MPGNHLNIERTVIGMSKNGIPVWYNKVSSHAATHISDTPGLLSLAAEIVGKTELIGYHVQFHTDMGRVVGNSDLVTVDTGDEILYAKRLNRTSYSVFNLTKPPQPSSLVTIACKKHRDGTYELVSTWIGPSDSPSFPGTERETPDSKDFWKNHALAWGTQEIQPSTKTIVCPW